MDQAERLAGHYLRELLVRPGRYRSRWEAHAQRSSGAGPNYSAVAHVLSTWLWHEGPPEFDDVLPRQIRDRVARALSGQLLTHETLEWFVEAFRLDTDDASRLRAIRDGSDAVTLVTGRSTPVPELEARADAYTTETVLEHHWIGPTGLPSAHRTSTVIRATEDDVRNYVYRFDTNALTVEVERGGRAGPVRQIADGLWGVEIVLSRPLQRLATASLTWTTTFRYAEPPPPEFRRGVLRRINSLDMSVAFHPEKVPSSVRWAVWDGFDGPVDHEEEVGLDDDLSVHRFVTAAERTVVGFRWTW